MTRKRKSRQKKRKHSGGDTAGESSESHLQSSKKSRHSEEPSCSSRDPEMEHSVQVSVQSSSLSGQQAAGNLDLSQNPEALGSMVSWRKQVQEWYPKLMEQTHFLPSAFMNRMQLGETQAAGERVLEIEPPVTTPSVQRAILDKDVREDKAQQEVLGCLQKLQRQPMFVISQLLFGNYLGEPAYAAAAKLLPRPGDLSLVSQNKDQGDFDILIIHKFLGILAGEIKSVGDNFVELGLSQDKQDKSLLQKVQKAIQQMEKSHDVLTHIVPQHRNQQPRIKTTLMLPNIARAQLSRALSTSGQTKKDLCEQLGLTENADPVPLCLTKDDLENPNSWWNSIMGGSDDVYLDLISRFCGPATTVTVHCPSTPRLALGRSSPPRSPGNGVAETARRFAPVDIMLHPKQVDLLNKNLPLVFIVGPPGTGKTVVLVIKARQWLREGKTVLIVTTQPDGLGASHMIKDQLEQQKRQYANGKVQLLSVDLTKGDSKSALTELQDQVQDGELYIIADEAFGGSTFRELCGNLHETMERLHIWAASLYHGRGPACLTEVVLTEPLRTPPRVTHEVQNSGFITQGEVKKYTTPAGPPPTEGPVILSLLHEGDGHSEGTTYDCKQCGRKIAKQLKKLGISNAASADDPRSYQHVFILTEEQNLVEKDSEEPDSSTAAPRPRGLLMGLDEKKIPYRVLLEDDSVGVEEVATMSGPNKMVVARSQTVSGLERPVVVWVQGDQTSGDENNGRLHAMSRATAQLIWVRNPP